ncbi:MAG: hypothetical protein GQF41_0176 [Candidatus Rifleibacterium amylolyticum]|nr:MAG: hypothetical protein GQF41_0176 [Candidatus Rifleibacterium amylolyticum]NLF97254.1 hypothetical protein [Candidatus Riflebacteria bacterium]
MNNFRNFVRYVKPALILSVLMMLLFPYSVIAGEGEYKIPENSISYVAQANNTSQPFMAASEREELEPEFTSDNKTVGQVQIIPEPETASSKEEALKSDERQSDSPLFSEALSKMQQNRAHRQAEAERLGIVLPSQGGDIAAVSPSLSKMQQTLKSIMAR